jgi:carbon storage regulator
MLKITRNKGESFIIGDDVAVHVFGVKGDEVKIGVEAPKNISVDRMEIREEKMQHRANKEADNGQNS